ncbi:MAG: hypothetical protein LC791_00550, partial [Acidobacteria bacterium]|nr:hypothetical protein [Acidobacteriota bacterium]
LRGPGGRANPIDTVTPVVVDGIDTRRQVAGLRLLSRKSQIEPERQYKNGRQTTYFVASYVLH